MKLKPIISVLVAGSIVIVSTGVMACICATRPPPEEAFAKADAVFLGTVAEMGPLSREVPIGTQSRMLLKPVLFRVIETWKGANVRSRVVYTGDGRGDCGYPFLLGSNYLIYAQVMSSNVLVTDICTRTCDESRATADLGVLGVGQKPKVKLKVGE
jgi:hypothetical protein